MKLHENQTDFLNAIKATSQATGIREVYIEKDYWVCYILKNLSESKFSKEVVFKGGTSLSKAHKVIHRFSEDVDLALLNTSMPDAQIKKKLKEIEISIAKAPLASIEKVGITSKGSSIRKTVWEYQKISQGEYGDASSELLLEINSFAIPSPFISVPIQTYIGEHLESINQSSFANELLLQPFQINVLEMKRTFAEKVSAVARASFESDPEHNVLKNKIRHLYDLTMLLRLPHMKKFLTNGEFKNIHAQVQKDDLAVPEAQAKHAEKEFRDAPIYKKSKETMESLRLTYEGQFSTLVYKPKDMPTIAEIIKALHQIKESP